MAPTSGGQYHWVSEFAPKSCQKFLSYIVGWLCVLGWQTGVASVGFLSGTMIQGLVVLNYPSYQPERWHGTLLVISIATFAVVFNTLLAPRLPLVEGTVLILHVFGFFAFLVTLWVMAPRTPAVDVFFDFQDNAGWGNIGLSCLVGMLAPVYALLGADSATHMSEEVRDASHVLPRAMMWSTGINSGLGLIMVITFMSCLGNVQDVIGSELTQHTSFPFLYVLYAATGSKAATSILTSILITMSIFGCVNNVATSSRQLFAFARDKALPFGEFLSFIRPGWDIPLNAIMVSFFISIFLALINIGSTVAFNIIAGLGVGALISSYIVSCSCMLLKRWRKERLLPSKFSLGRAGFLINLLSVAYLTLVFVMTFFPVAPHPAPKDMNWNILIYGVVVLFSLAYFVVKGRHQYAGPVEYTQKDV